MKIHEPPDNKRLRELGFEKGSQIDKLYEGFRGNPMAVRVCGAVITLRSEEAEEIAGETEHKGGLP